MKIVFMGTPTFAVPILKMLYEKHDVVLVVTQPDKHVGRKHVLTPSPVKVLATSLNLPVFQPKRIKQEFQTILNMQADVLITAAYGQILPKALIEGMTSLNIHGSLLPTYRGAAPIQYALFDGLHHTGVTIMEMVYEMDAGPIILQDKVAIDADDNFETLSNKLSELSVTLLDEVLTSFHTYFNHRVEQNQELVTFSPRLKYEDEAINFYWSTAKIINRIRGLSPEPGAHFVHANHLFKVYRAIKSDIMMDEAIPGTILLNKNKLTIRTKDGAIDIHEIQAHGKKRLPIKDFLNGQNVFQVGDVIKEDYDV